MARILIVDDEKENLNALKRALGDDNPDWEFITAGSGKQGVAKITKQLEKREPIDVILTDLVMENEQSGMNVLQEARRLDPLVMTILFTAKEKSLDRYAAFDFGAFDVVEKNIRGTAAVRELNIKTRAALKYREWSIRISFLRRYFDPQVFDMIEKEPTLLALRNCTLAVGFWDIRGFSALCESLKAHPELIAGFLKEFCDISARVIFANSGVLDKFVGDEVMGLFGVLDKTENQAKTASKAAVAAARALRTEFETLVDHWTEQWQLYVPNKIDIGLGCGIHTGEVLVGNVGTEVRDQFTALGPHVNFAARIQSRSGASQILISESTRSRIKDTFKTTNVMVIDDVKNIPGTFSIYEVVDDDD